MKEKSLILNLGSTSTKVAIYDSLNELFKISIQHTAEELSAFRNIWEQKKFRKEKIIQALNENNFDFKNIDVIACRGGLVKPVPSGVFEINESMLEDIRSEKYGTHPTSVGSFISYELGKEYRIPVITADLPVTDEMCNLARYTGIKGMYRQSAFQALNQKRTARLISNKLEKPYEEINLIIAHLGGGLSIAAHLKGKVVDVNNGLDGDGPFAPERAGTVQAGALVRMCFSGEYTENEILKMIKGNGGLMSHLRTNDALEVEERINQGDSYAAEVYEAMAYSMSKEIASMSAVLRGKVDAIVLTGSLTYSERLTNWIMERVNFIAPVYLYPGENEMLSLAEYAVRYLRKEIAPIIYV